MTTLSRDLNTILETVDRAEREKIIGHIGEFDTENLAKWLAEGAIQGGIVHGATDEIGFHAVEHRHYVTDIHATILHQLGLDSRLLEVPGRKRLDIDHGRPIHEILA